jgi:hypothetical protein
MRSRAVKKFLYVLGGVTLVTFGVIVLGAVLLVHNGNALDAESRDFVDSAVPAIAGNWSREELLGRATPELRAVAKPNDLTNLFNSFNRLGTFAAYDGATGQATMSYFGNAGGVVSATYVAKARFQYGTAVFRIALLKRDGHWMINNFYVDAAPTNQSKSGV